MILDGGEKARGMVRVGARQEIEGITPGEIVNGKRWFHGGFEKFTQDVFYLIGEAGEGDDQERNSVDLGVLVLHVVVEMDGAHGNYEGPIEQIGVEEWSGPGEGGSGFPPEEGHGGEESGGRKEKQEEHGDGDVEVAGTEEKGDSVQYGIDDVESTVDGNFHFERCGHGRNLPSWILG